MHRVWLNQDIFVLILEVLDKTSRRKVLSTLARTCRTLYDPSMDALWSVMGDVSPLVKCMPDSAWKISKMPLGLGRRSPALYLLDPKADDWKHLAKHAHRVKELSICTMGPVGPTDTLISGFLLSAISAYACEYSRTSGPLFPNLRTLSCDIYSSGRESLSCIPYLAGSDLSTLRMCTNRSVVTVSHNLSPLSDILARVQESAPSLDHLEVSFNPPYQLPHCSVDLLPVIGGFQEDQFSSLTLHFEFPKELLHKFAFGKRLTTLNLSLHHIRVNDIRFDRASVFAALQDLTRWRSTANHSATRGLCGISAKPSRATST
ncbi:hypothetical protein NM688_g6517 [Phlebia brevispora]|uniref:Uncharacterized protein n=1 Tax=Phlebia brevispora TaxID=194682 RepID=A0ACC1SF83_9APHY|nr:hypothetical protein NM688_g6517 [Phlebia brevispora]